jgi:NAD-dependent dihydropyrimidine dehydrogenase PreA subunit
MKENLHTNSGRDEWDGCRICSEETKKNCADFGKKLSQQEDERLLFVNWRRSADVCLACAKWRENGGAMRCLTWRHASACGSKA